MNADRTLLAGIASSNKPGGIVVTGGVDGGKPAVGRPEGEEASGGDGSA